MPNKKILCNCFDRECILTIDLDEVMRIRKSPSIIIVEGCQKGPAESIELVADCGNYKVYH